MNKVLVTLLLTLGITGMAQAAGDAKAGQAKAAMCGACHGADGNSAAPNFPKLAGQGERYLLKQMNDILRARLAARGIDVLSLEFGDIETNLAQARQKITVKQGIEQKIAKKIAAALKDAKLKVESQINGDKLRVQGKKRDDLQDAIAVLKAGKFELPLQFNNFRD